MEHPQNGPGKLGLDMRNLESKKEKKKLTLIFQYFGLVGKGQTNISRPNPHTQNLDEQTSLWLTVSLLMCRANLIPDYFYLSAGDIRPVAKENSWIDELAELSKS